MLVRSPEPQTVLDYTLSQHYLGDGKMCLYDFEMWFVMFCNFKFYRMCCICDVARTLVTSETLDCGA